MLPRTFVHLPGIGGATERRLWDRGIQTWAALRDSSPSLFRKDRREEVIRWLDDTEAAWDRKDLFFFYRNLPRAELWRLVPGFFDSIAFLDIETDGLMFPPRSRSTTVTFYYRGVLYQEHEHERKAELVRFVLSEPVILCSYFGEVFDIPFLAREFDLQIDKAHLDLCFWLKRLGYNGGLKKVERCFDDIPRRTSQDIDGFDAVRLWRMHQRGLKGALETLLAYNAEDTIVLKPLLVKAYNLEVESRPELGLTKIESGPAPKLPTEVDPFIFSRLRAGDV